jgi:hypothetical protein
MYNSKHTKQTNNQQCNNQQCNERNPNAGTQNTAMALEVNIELNNIELKKTTKQEMSKQDLPVPNMSCSIGRLPLVPPENTRHTPGASSSSALNTPPHPAANSTRTTCLVKPTEIKFVTPVYQRHQERPLRM